MGVCYQEPDSPSPGLTWAYAATSTVTAASQYTSAWSQVGGDNVLSYPDLISTQLDQKHLVIRQGVLSSGQYYSFRIEGQLLLRSLVSYAMSGTYIIFCCTMDAWR
eukprot:2779218-Rhodomonas_salina.4